MLLLCCCFRSEAQQYSFNYTKHCAAAYAHYLALRPEEGNAQIVQELRSDPYNLMATYIADYEDCLELIFNSDKAAYAQRRHHMQQRLSLLERGSVSSPWQRFCRAGIYLHWAFVNVRFGENFKAVGNFRKFHALLKENRRLHPGFDGNEVYYGLEETLLGGVPDSYKSIAAFFGLRGDVKRGVQRLAGYTTRHRPGDMLHAEATVFYAYMRFYLLSQQEEAYAYVTSSSFPAAGNLLFSFVKANICVNSHRADAAIATLREAQQLPGYKRYPVFDYEMGHTLLQSLNEDAASYLQSFTSRFKGDSFIKDAWQRMAYHYYMKGDMQQANACRARIKGSGAANTDADKQAARFGSHDQWPNKALLQVRLLTDGGYYQRALAIINRYGEEDFATIADRLEYYYRRGKLYHELGDATSALLLYNKAIAAGSSRPEQYAARAALQAGLLYEKQGNAPAAIRYYNTCLGMKDHDFQNAIDQQAKAGLNRLGQ